jgi:hypothetical protein
MDSFYTGLPGTVSSLKKALAPIGAQLSSVAKHLWYSFAAKKYLDLCWSLYFKPNIELWLYFSTYIHQSLFHLREWLGVRLVQGLDKTQTILRVNDTCQVL